MYHEPASAAIAKWRPLLETGLREDHWNLDWTARALPSRTKLSQAVIVAKGQGVWAAEGLIHAARAIFPELELTSSLQNGESTRVGQHVLALAGDAQEILALERPFLNLASFASGIATHTRQMVDAVNEVAKRAQITPPRVTLTRKTLPHYRDVAIDAVIAGGGFPHRATLSGGVLIKENHIAHAGSLKGAVTAVRGVAPHVLRVGCEVRNMDEFREAKRAAVDWVLLDNFSPAQVVQACAEKDNLLIEVSGGLTLTSLGSYVIPGVDVLSVGSLTHTVRPLDLSLLWSQLARG